MTYKLFKWYIDSYRNTDSEMIRLILASQFDKEKIIINNTTYSIEELYECYDYPDTALESVVYSTERILDNNWIRTICDAKDVVLDFVDEEFFGEELNRNDIKFFKKDELIEDVNIFESRDDISNTYSLYMRNAKILESNYSADENPAIEPLANLGYKIFNHNGKMIYPKF